MQCLLVNNDSKQALSKNIEQAGNLMHKLQHYQSCTGVPEEPAVQAQFR
jgi:hypothetical protein